MEHSEKTLSQIERFINKTSSKFPSDTESFTVTDIHIRVSQESGEMVSFDDDDREITRCVINQWIGNKDEDFYLNIASILRKFIHENSGLVENIGILKPFSIVLETEDKESISELYVADDDTVIIGGELMENLDKDLDDFLSKLMKE